MADELYTFQVTTTAGTAKATPTTTALTIPVRVVRHITIFIPPGPHGQLGVRLAANGTQIMPVNVGGWIVADHDRIDFDAQSWIESGAFQLQSYNTGDYDHTVEIRLEVDLPPQKRAGAIFQPLAI